MENEIVKIIEAPELSGLEPSKAEQIKSTFEPMAEMLVKFEGAFSEIVKESKRGITKETADKAKRLRIDIGKVRISTEKLRKDQKEEFLRAGKAIDGVSNILKWAISSKEDQLKEIENHLILKAEEEKRALQAKRVQAISEFLEDAHERNLSNMEPDVWAAYLDTKKKEHRDRIEAEKTAEAERVAAEKAEIKERERIAAENEVLRKQAEEREKAEIKEREKRDKEAAEVKAAHEAETAEIHRETLKIEKEERLKREKLEAELKEKTDAEEKRKAEEAAKIQAELSKGDTAKINDLINDLTHTKTRYEFKAAKNKKIGAEVSQLLEKIIIHIHTNRTN